MVCIGSRPNATMLAARYVHVDIDPPKGCGHWDSREVLAQLKSLACSPSFVVASGGGLQAFWRLDPDAADLSHVAELNRQVAQQLGGDHCHNIDRLMRVAGTVNWPAARKAKDGRTPVLARLLAVNDEARYSLERLALGFTSADQWSPALAAGVLGAGSEARGVSS